MTSTPDNQVKEEMDVSTTAGQSSDNIFTQRVSLHQSETVEQQENEKPFYFETDHVALKGNKDYQNLLRVVVTLEAQRKKAIQDLDKLIEGQAKAMEDPIEFVKKLQHGVDLGLPGPQKVCSLPHINWDNYSSSFSAIHRHQTRRKEMRKKPETQVEAPVAPQPQTSDEGRTVSFNKPWSVEEQQRLEQLLIEYPAEEVEARRWAKIAKALKNRTMLQVASRVQKYFIKLAKAGLPIPGRMPNLNIYARKGSSHRHQRHNRFYQPHSTFLASHQAPVYMAEEEEPDYTETPPSSVAPPIPNDETSDDDDIPLSLRNSDEYRQIQQLKQLRRQKVVEQQQLQSRHDGYKCDSCKMDPIVGTRWHCLQCPDDISVDFCSDCVDILYG